jgi:hypothetical protein
MIHTRLLDYDTVYLGRHTNVFRRFSCPGMARCGVRCLVPDISKEHSTSIFIVKTSLFWTAGPEDEGSAIIRIVNNYTQTATWADRIQS